MAKTWHTRHAKFIGDTDKAVRDHKDPTDTYFCPLAKLLRVHGAGRGGEAVLWPGSVARVCGQGPNRARYMAGTSRRPFSLPNTVSAAQGHPVAPSWNPHLTGR